MKLMRAAAATLLVWVVPVFGQEPRTGVSTPAAATAGDLAPGAPAPAPAETAVQEMVPGDMGADANGYRPTPGPAAASIAAAPVSPAGPASSFRVVGPYTADRPVATPLASQDDADAGIVTLVPHGASECPPGTLLKVRMRETLSTKTTARGTTFTAELVEPVQESGRVLLPAGSTLRGRVTYVHGGKRIGGLAALHLEAQTLVLPDGTEYAVRAQVIDTDQSFATRIDSEGTIVRREHLKGTLAAMSLTTGSAAVAGAVIGGGVGAAVGAGVGAGLSAAWWLKQDRQTELPRDTGVVFSLNDSLALGTAGMSGAGR